MSSHFTALLVGAGVAALSVILTQQPGSSGNAAVIDGDTIELDGGPIRILDIDAPELGQPYRTKATRGLAVNRRLVHLRSFWFTI